MTTSFSVSQKHLVYLALGSNLGDRQAHLKATLEKLREVIDIQRVSSIYETEPVGFLEQPRFLNLVCSGQTALSPQELLAHVKALESTLGRLPTFRNGPRTIDIDILLYDDLQIVQEHLIIPHPRMLTRAFVLLPLAEIAPSLVEPASGKTIEQLLMGLPLSGVQKIAHVL